MSITIPARSKLIGALEITSNMIDWNNAESVEALQGAFEHQRGKFVVLFGEDAHTLLNLINLLTGAMRVPYVCVVEGGFRAVCKGFCAAGLEHFIVSPTPKVKPTMADQ